MHKHVHTNPIKRIDRSCVQYKCTSCAQNTQKLFSLNSEHKYFEQDLHCAHTFLFFIPISHAFMLQVSAKQFGSVHMNA